MKRYYIVSRKDGASSCLDAETLEEAKAEADRWIDNMGSDVDIILREWQDYGDYDETLVAVRPWRDWDRRGYKACSNPIRYGTRGYYADWVDIDDDYYYYRRYIYD